MNLRELLRLAFDEPITWLTGSGQGDVPVAWVSVTLGEAQSGDALLLLGETMDPAVLGSAHSQKVAAIIVLGDAFRLGEVQNAPLPVVTVPAKLDIRVAQRRLLTALINQRTSLVERGARVHAQLSQMAAEGVGLAGLAQAIAEISGRGVLLQDKRLNPLAAYPSSGLHAIWDDLLPALMAGEALPEPLRDRKRAGQAAAIIQQEIPGGLARAVIPVAVGGVVRGYFSLVGETGRFDALDRLVLEQGALVFAVEMARTKAVREAEKRLKGDLLTALLQEDLSPRDAQLWVQTMGLDLGQAHAALRFAWDAASPPSRRRLETVVNGEIARLGLKVIVNPMGAEVVCFCQVPRGQGRPEVALGFGQAVLDQAAHEYPEAPARCGVGLPADDLSTWRTSFREAGQALELARRLGGGAPLYFPDLSVYRLLLQIEHNPELIAFQEEILGPLLAYEGGEELIRTLEAYFEKHGNRSQAAEALFIHRNTLLYRLERIAALSGLDLDNPETRLAVQLALRLRRLMG